MLAFGDPYTHLLLHMDGSNGGTSFVDSSMYHRTVTAVGNINTSTAQKKTGTAAASTDEAGDYLSVSGFNPGTSAFCLEGWVYVSTTGRTNILYSYGGAATENTFVVFTNHAYEPLNYLTFYSNGDTRIRAAAPIAAGAWHHVAVVGNGGAAGSRTVKLYLDGTQVGSTYTVDYNYTGKTLLIGANEDTPSTECLQGYVDEVRGSIGTPRYTGNFTPQETAFAA